MQRFKVFILFGIIALSGCQITQNDEKQEIRGNILYIDALASPSHQIWNRSLMKALVKKGYNVTILSVDTDRAPTPGIHYINMKGVFDVIYDSSSGLDLIEWSTDTVMEEVRGFFKFLRLNCLGALKSREITQLLEYPDDFKFDLLIYDSTCGPCLLGFMDKFNNPPLVLVSALNDITTASLLTGTPTFPSFVPNFQIRYSPANMGFFQRSLNTFVHFYETFVRCQTVKIQDEMAREVFGDQMTDLREIEKRGFALLSNSHPAMDWPVPSMPNLVHVGGLQIEEPRPLSKELNDFIERAPNGAILFSLGTNLKSEMMGKEKISMFVNAFKRLPQYHFLWKFDSDELPSLSSNVLVAKWLPQSDVLAHSGIRCFITHSGLLSSQEATWRGVPMLGMPFFGDQQSNIYKLIEAGVAEKLDFRTLTEDQIVSSLLKILKDPSYSTNMARLSSLFRDRPMHPRDLAVWWVEHAIRTASRDTSIDTSRDTSRPISFELPFHVAHMWDLLLVWTGVLVLFIILIVKLIRRIVFGKIISKAEKYKKN